MYYNRADTLYTGPDFLYLKESYTPEVSPKIKENMLDLTYYRVRRHFGGFRFNDAIRPLALVRAAIKYREGFRLSGKETKVFMDYLMWKQDSYREELLKYLFSKRDEGSPFTGLIRYYNTFGVLTEKQENSIRYERGDLRKRCRRCYCEDLPCDYDGYDPEPRSAYWRY